MSKEPDGLDSLIDAIRHHDEERVRFLLDTGTDPDGEDGLPLLTATDEGNLSIVRMLAPVSDIKAEGYSSVFLALERENIAILSELVSHFDTDEFFDILESRGETEKIALLSLATETALLTSTHSSRTEKRKTKTI